jgi:hypothetical protein
MKRVGLLVGRERTFPDALIAEVERRDCGVVAEYAKIEATRIDAPPAYDVLVDRISHDVTCYQPVLKLAALSMAYSRVHLGVHHPSDVVAGYALGAVTGRVARLVVRARRRR